MNYFQQALAALRKGEANKFRILGEVGNVISGYTTRCEPYGFHWDRSILRIEIKT